MYSSELEELRRHIIWQANKKFVGEHNAHADEFGYTVGLYAFSDLESSEFARIYNGYRGKPATNSSSKTFTANSMVPAVVPATMDWRTKGVVTEVKDQKQCGSCWAFSATGSLEGQHALKTGTLVSLSEQQLVDCSGSYGNHGCNGGWTDRAFKYIKDNGGDDTEKSYPYKAHDRKCQFNPNTVGATATGYVDIERMSENALLQAVGTIGPISVAIDASHKSFQHYKKGVYNEPACSQTRLDHAVLVVGYGTDKGQPYWLVKNSWGKKWGMNGYIMMSANKDNQCGIATEASYPTV